VALAVLASAWLGGSVSAHAQTCAFATHTYPNPDGENRFRINVAQFQSHLGIPQSRVGFMVEHAASTWNLSGRSGWFRLMGTTTLENELCELPAHYWNRVTMSADWRCIFGRAFAIPVCQGQHWWINVCPGFPWSTIGDPDPDQIDLIATLVHEFGHVLNLGHPPTPFCGAANGGAVMCTDALPGKTMHRELYSWDVTCSYDAADARDTRTYARLHSSGSFGAESLVTPVDGFRGAPGAVEVPSLMWFRAMHRSTVSDRTWLTTYNSASNNFPSQTLNLGERGLQLSVVWWHEQIDRIRAIFLYEISTPGGWNQTWGARSAIYAPDFSGGLLGTPWLRHCTSGSGPSCPSQIVRTGHRLSHAHDNVSDVSVTAWMHQSRTSGNEDREIRIAYEYQGGERVGVPYITGIRTSVAPAIACNYPHADGFACLVAYVDFNDPDYRVRVRAFIRFFGTLVWHPNVVTMPVPTTHGVALWYHNGLWWLAANQSVLTGGSLEVRVYSSSDGQSWSYATGLGPSIQAPAVVSYRVAGDNRIMISR